MAAPERSTQYHIVTSSPARTKAFESLFGSKNVCQVAPRFTEDIIRKPVNNQPAEWPMEMSERKALQDLAAHLVHSYLNGVISTGCEGDFSPDGKRIIRVYSDTINIAYAGDTADETTVVLEKPPTIAKWMADRERGAMALSGKNTEMCTAITAIDMTDPNVHPTTVLVRTAVKMKPFTPEDVKKFIARHGDDAVLKAASGISFSNESVELFDTSSPLRTYIQIDPNLPPSLLFEIPTWEHLPQDDRRRILYGAIPEVMQIVTNEFKQSYPPTISGGNKN